MKRGTVCIFCASSDTTPEIYRHEASRMGELCASEGITIVNGGGKVGLMGQCSEACLSHSGNVVGVIPRFMVERGWGNDALTQLIITPDMSSRKQRMRDLSDGIIALPGGCGTLEEIFEAVTQRQMGFYPHPIILLNTAGFFSPIADWWIQALKDHFMHTDHACLWTLADTPEEALRLFKHLPEDQKDNQQHGER